MWALVRPETKLQMYLRNLTDSRPGERMLPGRRPLSSVRFNDDFPIVHSTFFNLIRSDGTPSSVTHMVHTVPKVSVEREASKCRETHCSILRYHSLFLRRTKYDNVEDNLSEWLTLKIGKRPESRQTPRKTLSGRLPWVKSGINDISGERKASKRRETHCSILRYHSLFLRRTKYDNVEDNLSEWLTLKIGKRPESRQTPRKTLSGRLPWVKSTWSEDNRPAKMKLPGRLP